MAQISRPFQIGLAALAVFVLAWFAVLHRPGSSPSEPAPAPASAPAAGTAAAPATAAKPSSPGSSSPVYHGAAPGVEGLTRDIAKAHGAVRTSEQNARQLQERSAQASGEAGTSAASAPAPAASVPSSAAAGTTRSSRATRVHPAAAPKPSAAAAAASATARQAAQQAVLGRELKQGKVLLLLFWNPKATDDQSVRAALGAVSGQQRGRVAVHVALAGQVSLYGSVTRNVGVFQTPTLLIVAKQGLAVTMTGLVDQYAIEQAIIEARKASA
jgi:hypothetical protein